MRDKDFSNVGHAFQYYEEAQSIYAVQDFRGE